MRKLALALLLLVPVALSLAPARAQSKAPAVGDVVLFHAFGEERAALVIDDAGPDGKPVLVVFLTPADVEELACANACDPARAAHLPPTPDGKPRPTVAQPLTAGKRRLCDSHRDGDRLVLSADEGDWSPR